MGTGPPPVQDQSTRDIFNYQAPERISNGAITQTVPDPAFSRSPWCLDGELSGSSTNERMDRLEQIEVPVLAVAFEFDPLFGPAQAQLAVDRIPGAELCVIPEAAHGGVMTHGQHVVPRIVGFLTEHHS
ncbi:alpha/beta hydrolase [Nocardia sp. NPDC051981]|uniref:alpha/beta fold hydrolase n=1 Tax=Nocardia sp. NPDC051981 TaxID=3155417 RepID=UPI003438C903